MNAAHCVSASKTKNYKPKGERRKAEGRKQKAKSKRQKAKGRKEKAKGKKLQPITFFRCRPLLFYKTEVNRISYGAVFIYNMVAENTFFYSANF